ESSSSEELSGSIEEYPVEQEQLEWHSTRPRTKNPNISMVLVESPSILQLPTLAKKGKKIETHLVRRRMVVLVM
ncbi:hypothetical protein HAX54_052812, partial [Datura stramonium]|nr:hypothetical protein [Datura stramonium]